MQTQKETARTHEFPSLRECRELHESRKCHELPTFPESLVSPVSKGQEKALKAFGARNACTAQNTARKRRWKLTRDLRALEKGIGRELSIGELMIAFDEWHRLSHSFLDSQKTCEDYLAAFLAGLRKVRVPTGEGNTFNKALEAVAKMPVSALPTIPGIPNAHESWRRVLALHCEMSRLCSGKAYFLSCRDTAKAFPGLSHQTAFNINLALARLGAIEIVRKGKAGLNSRKAAEFRYLLSQSENGEAQAEDDCPFG